MPLGPMPALNFLGSWNFSGAAASIGPFTFSAYNTLIIEYIITGYGGGGDIGAFQFNADTTAGNYGSTFWTATNAATPTIARSAANAGTIAMVPVSGTAIGIGRRGSLRISNVAANRKVCDIRNANESATSTGPTWDVQGWGEWLNTAAQITQIKMLTVGGANLNAGSGFAVFGINI